MFETEAGERGELVAAGLPGPPSGPGDACGADGVEAEVAALTAALRTLAMGDVAGTANEGSRGATGAGVGAGAGTAVGAGGAHRDPDATRIEMIATLEALKAAACAAQARLSAVFAASQRARQRDAGVPAARCGRGVSAQVALARGESPHQGGRLLGMAEALVKEMPCTLNALAHGALNEWRATLLVRESACLSVADRATLDREVCGCLDGLAGAGDRRLVAHARTIAQRLDAAALVKRARRAESERCVTLRPAPDTMTYLTALLPMKDGVAAYAALQRAAQEQLSSGDAASRGQAMADTLVARVTGREPTAPVPVHVGLVMTETALFAPQGAPGTAEPATVTSPGVAPITVPAAWARDLVDAAARHDATTAHDATRPEGARNGVGVWFRRLFADPTSGELAAMDSRSRCAPPNLVTFLGYRDQTCRTPRCDAPIRHHDHVTTVLDGGTTTAANLQGLCEACNHAKQAPGWHQSVAADPRHRVLTRTPTGHTYASNAPPLPGYVDTGPDPTEPGPLPTIDLMLSELERYLTVHLEDWRTSA